MCDKIKRKFQKHKMSKYSKTTLVNTLRMRIGLERAAMQRFGKLDGKSLRRIEAEKQDPKAESFEGLMKAIDIPMEGFVYPLLDYLSMEDIIRRDLLSQLLDIGDAPRAEGILAELEANPGFGEGIHRQFVLSKKAQLWEQKGEAPERILPLIDEAMAETFDDFDEGAIGKSVLVLEEPDLLHTKARVHAKAGEIDAAIRLLELMKSSLVKMPVADKEKERTFAPVLLTLSSCLLQMGAYGESLESCKLGAEYSATRMQGRLNPDFELSAAYALRGLERMGECLKHLQHAYFGYALMGERAKADNALEAAKQDFGIQFELYGVDKLHLPDKPGTPYSRGQTVACGSIGSMIRALRERAGLSLNRLSLGICDKGTLQKIEKGGLDASFFILEAIVQRLGRDVGLYQNFFLSKSDFAALQLRDRINILIITRRFDDAAGLLDEFEGVPAMKYSVNRQFAKFFRAQIFAASSGAPQPKMMLDALRVTYVEFNERSIDRYPLTYCETAIINQYAGHCGSAGDSARAADIYERLLRTLNERYDDEGEKARAYTASLFNYSTYLGRLEQRQKALAAINEGMAFAHGKGHVLNLPGLAFNKGYNELKLNKDADVLPHIALAYYGASMFSEYGMSQNMRITGDFAKETFGKKFD